ncbi:MAG TPA: glycosyltransferase family 2 protein [Candidatus Omnitrophica bacterium]|nr:glycosyltransferase family 2 protein [Candidatus Omnitrophota bacterium]
MESKKNPLSVVIITKNEEENIDKCLKSVSGWADEIIVLDDESTDKTAEIATRYTDKVYTKKMDIEGRYRNYAYSLSKNDWVLSLDADEIVTDELKSEIDRTLSVNTKYNAFSIPLKNYIGDYWVRFGGWYPAAKVRLFRKDKFKYEEVGVHPRIFLEGECGHLKGDIIHRGYPDITHFLNSLNYQTTKEAEKWYNDKRRMSFLRAMRKTVDRFFRAYIIKQGFRDGFIGLVVAVFSGLYQFLSYAKYRQLKKQNEQDQQTG